MKTKAKQIIIALLTIQVVILSCKKKEETKVEEPVTPTPTPTPVYSTFATTIAVVDYTAPVNISTAGYTANLSPTTTAIAYIVADSIRIDSLPLAITRTTDIVPSSVTSGTADVCDFNIWNTYTLNSKEFKLKIGAKNELQIFEDGVKIASRPIKMAATYNQYEFSGGYVTTSPKTSAIPCADGKRFRVIQ